MFSRLIAEDINSNKKTGGAAEAEYEMSSPKGNPLPHGIRTEVRHIMQKAYFIFPRYDEVEKGLARIKELRKLLLEGGFEITSDYVETRSLVTCAYIILTELMERKDEKE